MSATQHERGSAYSTSGWKNKGPPRAPRAFLSPASTVQPWHGMFVRQAQDGKHTLERTSGSDSGTGLKEFTSIVTSVTS